MPGHISNRHIDLQPVFWQLAQEYQFEILKVERYNDLDEGEFPSLWILLTQDPAAFGALPLASSAETFDGYSTSVRLWTDDYSNLFQLLK